MDSSCSPLVVLAAGGSVSPLVGDLGLCLVAAGLLAIAFVKLKIPAIAALLGAGVVLGPAGLEAIQDRASIDTIANLGLTLLLFVTTIVALAAIVIPPVASQLLLLARELPEFVAILQGQLASLLVRYPDLRPIIGDTVDVHTKILEGNKERIQIFNGVVIARAGSGSRETFTVRRIVAGEGVERKFPLHSPKIDKVEVKRSGVARRAKLYFLRDRVGKAVRLREQRAEKAKSAKE